MNDFNKNFEFIDELTKVNLRANPTEKTNGNKKIKVYYRLSNLEATVKKIKIPNASKKNCLENCISEFGSENITVIGDSLNDKTLQYLNSLNLKFIEVDFASGASTFRYALNLAIKENKNKDYVYLLEDDFLHLPGSEKLLKEGIEKFDTYITLYDHPDKYMNFDEEYGNPKISFNSEITRLFKTKSINWKFTNSTVMSFACTVERLEADYKLLIKYSRNKSTDSFGLFTELIQTKRLSPVSSIPGYSTHCEKAWLSPFINWEKISKHNNLASVSYLHREINIKNEIIENLKSENLDLKSENLEIKKTLLAIEETLLAVQKSTTWRYTKFLRRIIDKLKSLKTF